MSIGLRDQRAFIYAYQNVGEPLWQDTRYVRQSNPSSDDGAYWVRKEAVSAREQQIAFQAQHQVDVVFAFADHVFVPTDGVIKHGESYYKVQGVYIARMMREMVVHAVEATDEVYNNVIEQITATNAQATFVLSLVFSATATVAGPLGDHDSDHDGDHG